MRVIIITCFLMISTFLQAEDFYVLHIKGKISVKSGVFLKLGDKITEKHKITFVDADAVAILMSSKRGRVSLENNAKKSEKEIDYLVSDLIEPSSGQLSTRGVQYVVTIMDLKNHIKGTNYPVINTRKIPIPLKLPVIDDNYYFIAFDYQGKKIKNKLLVIDNQLLVIDKKVYTFNNKIIPFDKVENSELCYYSAINDQEVFIEKFHPYFLNEEELKNQIESFLSINKKLKTLSKNPKEDLLKFLCEAYGNIDEMWLKEFYRNEFETK